MPITPEDAAFAARSIGATLRQFPMGPAELAMYEQIVAHSENTQTGFFDAAVDLDIDTPPQLWADMFSELVRTWDDPVTKERISNVASNRRFLEFSGDENLNELIDHAADAYAELVSVADPNGQVDEADLAQIMLDVARSAEICGAHDDSYNIAAAGMNMAPEVGAEREALVRFALANATRAQRAHQIFVCKAFLAIAVLRASANAPARKLEAFDMIEELVESLSSAPEQVRSPIAAMLMSDILQFDFTSLFALQLGAYMPQATQHPDYATYLVDGAWPSRFVEPPDPQWMSTVMTRPAASHEAEIDDIRIDLEPPAQHSGPFADWMEWTVEHPAYRRAVPHNKSFLRDAHFDDQLLELAHEVTHVFSFISPVGIALTALRVALFENESTLWSNVARELPEALQRIASEGVTNPSSGDAIGLLRVERRIDLVEKMWILQDCWTAWFEGLALFSESAADPSLDPNGISPVIEALRGLVDLYIDVKTREEAQLAVEAIHQEFEVRCQAAMSRVGLPRLSAHLRLTSAAPYFQGYVLVRSVVSSWEQTLGRNLSGTEAFSLLLHATRYGTANAIPDLSRAAEDFLDDALTAQVEYLRTITRCPKADLEQFLIPPAKDALGKSYFWQGERLLPLVKSPDEAYAVEEAHRKRVLEQALDSTISDEFPDTQASLESDVSSWLATTLIEVYRKGCSEEEDRTSKYYRILNDILTSGALLPVGRTSARFNAALAGGKPHAALAFRMRTTEQLATTGKPSTNGMIFQLEAETIAKLQSEYMKLRSPRFQVMRCIDTAGFVRPGTHGSCQLLVYSYGDWIYFRGSSPYVQIILENDPDRYKQIESLVRFRLAPSSTLRAERDLIAPGKLAVQKTGEWLAASTEWDLDGNPVQVDGWIGRLRSKYLLSKSVDRRQRQHDFAHGVLKEVWKDPAAAQAASRGFDSLTQSSPGDRDDLLRWLYEGGRNAPGWAPNAQVIAKVKESLSSFVVQGPLGLAIRPVVN